MSHSVVGVEQNRTAKAWLSLNMHSRVDDRTSDHKNMLEPTDFPENHNLKEEGWVGMVCCFGLGGQGSPKGKLTSLHRLKAGGDAEQVESMRRYVSANGPSKACCQGEEGSKEPLPTWAGPGR